MFYIESSQFKGKVIKMGEYATESYKIGCGAPIELKVRTEEGFGRYNYKIFEDIEPLKKKMRGVPLPINERPITGEDSLVALCNSLVNLDANAPVRVLVLNRDNKFEIVKTPLEYRPYGLPQLNNH